MEIIENLCGQLYVYCTDFIINMSNLLGISYYEFNFIIFCLVLPFLTLLLGIRFLYLNYKLYKIKKATL
jgi:hypothetical protein